MAKIELALCLLWVAAAAGLNFSSDDGQLERKQGVDHHYKEQMYARRSLWRSLWARSFFVLVGMQGAQAQPHSSKNDAFETPLRSVHTPSANSGVRMEGL